MARTKDSRERPFWHCSNDLVDDCHIANMGVNAFAVYCVIVRHADNTSDRAFPSVSRIQEKTGLARPTVIKGLKALGALGYIKKVKQGTAIGSPSVYEIQDESNVSTSKPGELVNEINGFTGLTSKSGELVNLVNATSKRGEPQLVNEVNPNNTHLKRLIEKDSLSSAIAESVSHEVSHEVAQPELLITNGDPYESSDRYCNPPAGDSGEDKKNAPPKISRKEYWGAFWAECPRKIGKKAAEKAFNKVPEESLSKVVPSLIAQKEEYRRSHATDWNFFPHPTTWLNQGRYDDETEEEVSPQSPSIPTLPNWLTAPDDRFVSWLAKVFLPQKPGYTHLASGDPAIAIAQAESWLARARHGDATRFDEAAIAWKAFGGNVSPSLSGGGGWDRHPNCEEWLNAIAELGPFDFCVKGGPRESMEERKAFSQWAHESGRVPELSEN